MSEHLNPATKLPDSPNEGERRAHRTVDPPREPSVLELPGLPDLDDILKRAVAHRDEYQRIADEALAEVGKAQEYIDKLGGEPKPPRPKTDWRYTISDETLERVVDEIYKHNGCSVETLTRATGLSQTTVNRATRKAREQGRIRIDMRGRKQRYFATTNGDGSE